MNLQRGGGWDIMGGFMIYGLSLTLLCLGRTKWIIGILGRIFGSIPNIWNNRSLFKLKKKMNNRNPRPNIRNKFRNKKYWSYLFHEITSLNDLRFMPKTYKIHIFFTLLQFLEVEVVYGNPFESFIKMLLQLFQPEKKYPGLCPSINM